MRFFLRFVAGTGFLAAFLAQSCPLGAVSLTIRTAEGDTVFFAPAGDTVEVVVSVDSGGEKLTGVEVFVGFNARLFQAVDAHSDAGVQPAVPGGLLQNVLADTLLFQADTLGLVHYAEADLAGRPVSGRLFSARFRISGWLSGLSEIALRQNMGGRWASTYTVPNVEGRVFELAEAHSLYFKDLPPALRLPDSLEVEEDGVLVVDLRQLATDEAGAEMLTWQVAAPGSLVSVAWETDGRSGQVAFRPAQDFNGLIPLVFKAADPAMGQAAGSVPLHVLPVNDAPHIRAGVLPDSVILSERTYTLTLAEAAQDVDDPVASLVWQVRATRQIRVAFEADTVMVISAPSRWSGEETVRLLLVDPSGASDEALIRVVRHGPLPSLDGDFNMDDRVDFSDFLAFAGAFGRPDAAPVFDLDGNGQVDFPDFLIFVRNYGRTYP